MAPVTQKMLSARPLSENRFVVDRQCELEQDQYDASMLWKPLETKQVFS